MAGKYTPLELYFRDLPLNQIDVTLTFEQIERILRDKLPRSAYIHRPWWVNQESPLSVENPSQAVWHYDRLPDELGNIWQGRKLVEQDQKKIIEKLTKLCERQKKAS